MRDHATVYHSIPQHAKTHHSLPQRHLCHNTNGPLLTSTPPNTLTQSPPQTGIASAVFSTVRDAGVNVIMISQASSEHSICFAVKASEGDLAVKVLKKRFADSISAGR